MQTQLLLWLPLLHRAWPKIDSTYHSWSKHLSPLFQLLCAEKVIYTSADEGKWLHVQDAIFVQVNENETKELIVRVLLEANQPVALLPDHVLNAITERTEITEVSPSLLRQVLKETPSCYETLSHTEKLSLLRFVLADDDFPELLGLVLLPLSDGTFTTFTKSAEVVYITSPEHPRELIPGLRERFLNQDVDKSILRKLKTIAAKGIKFFNALLTF